MSDVLFLTIGAILLAFLVYRQACCVRYALACWRARLGPFRGIRIVYRRSAPSSAPFRSTSGHLRLVATSRKVSG